MSIENQPAPGPLEAELLAIERSELSASGRTPLDLILGDVEEAREDLIAAMKRADKFDEPEAHMRITSLVDVVDNLRAWLQERGTRE